MGELQTAKTNDLLAQMFNFVKNMMFRYSTLDCCCAVCYAVCGIADNEKSSCKTSKMVSM